MRLINTTTLQQVQFSDAAISRRTTRYAILSHCWGAHEIDFETFMSKHHRSGLGWKKIEDCCALAKCQGIKWAWVDSCCIDKRSSAELTEAINSMWSWYKRASVCYVFLHDFHATAYLGRKEADFPFAETARKPDRRNMDVSLTTFQLSLSSCRWWFRGWTLQELIAPSNVWFYDKDLVKFGTKDSLADFIAPISKIDKNFLVADNVHKASIAQRMSWASMRKTTRTEDMAYCLMGIFDVNMPLLYGEGEKAFLRLQEAILARSNDESIFAWTSNSGDSLRGILAESPREFADSWNIVQDTPQQPRLPYHVTNLGLELIAPLSVDRWIMSSFQQKIQRNVLTLNCSRLLKSQTKQPLAITLVLPEPLGFSTMLYRQNTAALSIRRNENSLVKLMRLFNVSNMTQHIALHGTPEKLLVPQASAARIYRPYTPYRRMFFVLPLLYLGCWWHPASQPWTFADVTLVWAVLTFSWQLANQSSTHLLYMVFIVIIFNLLGQSKPLDRNAIWYKSRVKAVQ